MIVSTMFCRVVLGLVTFIFELSVPSTVEGEQPIQAFRQFILSTVSVTLTEFQSDSCCRKRKVGVLNHSSHCASVTVDVFFLFALVMKVD